MSQPKDEDVVQTDATGVVRHAAGRVEIDSRGNSVWKWAKDVIDSTSILLKRLENKDLALEPTQKVPVMGGKADKRGGASSLDLAERGGKGAQRDLAERAGKRPQLDLAERAGSSGGKGSGKSGGFDPYNSRR